jgi:hypothetical protein
VDYLNLTDSEFDNFFKVLNDYVAHKCVGGTPEWTHIPAAARQELLDAYAVWHTAYENEGGKRGPWSDVVSVSIA